VSAGKLRSDQESTHRDEAEQSASKIYGSSAIHISKWDPDEGRQSVESNDDCSLIRCSDSGNAEFL